MFSHVFVGVRDFDRALAFYQALMPALNVQQRFVDHDRPWAAWQQIDKDRPIFIIGKPFDGQPHAPGNGQMTAFQVAQRSAVDAAFRIALAHGGTGEGEPGLRPEYHPDYYGAYLRDTEGNKLCIVCHGGEP